VNAPPTYTFTVLQYRHSQLLGEVLNVALLIYFPKFQNLTFVYPNKLTRITSAYPNVQEGVIKNYLRSFSLRIDQLNKSPEIFARIDLDESFVRFISNELIPEDSSALQFDTPKRGMLNSQNIESVKKRLYDTYFTAFEFELIENSRVDEAILFSRYKTYIKELEQNFESNISQRITYDYELKPREGEVFKFDAAWQNGSLNLVKSISFDLARPDRLQNKAFRFYGQFLELEDYAAEKNCRFDLLLAKPKKRELFSNYENAIRLLSKPKNVTLISEEDLKDYSKKTLEDMLIHKNMS